MNTISFALKNTLCNAVPPLWLAVKQKITQSSTEQTQRHTEKSNPQRIYTGEKFFAPTRNS